MAKLSHSGIQICNLLCLLFIMVVLKMLNLGLRS
jgi:hypothetical protein